MLYRTASIFQINTFWSDERAVNCVFNSRYIFSFYALESVFEVDDYIIL